MDSFEKLTDAELKKRQTVNTVVAFVSSRWQAAVSARSTVTADMVKVVRALQGTPLSGSHLIPELPLTYNITASIHRGIVALITDAFAATSESLFVVSTTTVPTIEDDVLQEIEDAVIETMQIQQAETGVLPADEVALDLREEMMFSVREALKIRAQDAAKELGDDIKDSFEENGWGRAITQAVSDFVAYPAMVIKAPAPVYKKKKVWVDNVMRITQEITQGVERIAPYNFYPAPNAQDVETADYLFELRTISANELAALAEDIAYDAKEISRVFAEHETGFSIVDSANDSKLFTTPNGLVQNQGVGFYDVQCFYGKIMGSHLSELGIEGTDPTRQYDAEVFVIGSCVIRAVLTGESGRPFHTLAYDPIPGSLWGHSPVTRLFDIQSVANNAFPAMVRDLQISGLHIELDTARLAEDDKLESTSITPGVVRLVKPSFDGTSSRAYNLFSVQSTAAAFREVINDLEEKAYKQVGFTRMTLGETQGSGTIGRTAGGVAAMLNQSAKGLRQVLRAMENQIIEPIVQSFIDHRLMNDPPEYIRGDVNVRARGLTGLVEREGQVESLQWQLQTLAAFAEKVDPATGKPIIPATVPLAIVKQMFRAKGLSTKGVFPDEDGGVEQPALAEGQQEVSQGMPLDNRSAVAKDAISTSNNPMGMSNA
jgi:hypothetical protein